MLRLDHFGDHGEFYPAHLQVVVLAARVDIGRNESAPQFIDAGRGRKRSISSFHESLRVLAGLRTVVERLKPLVPA